MSKRRVAGNLLFNGKGNALKHPAHIVVVLTGTGTATRGGVLTLVAPAAPTKAQLYSTGSVYLTMSANTNIGTLVGTGLAIGTGV